MKLPPRHEDSKKFEKLFEIWWLINNLWLSHKSTNKIKEHFEA
jgi:hypothetical protein